MAPAGEEVHVATLHFEVLGAAAEIAETSLAVVPITDHRGLVHEPFIVVRHRNGLGVAQSPVANNIEPITVTNGLFRIVRQRDDAIRGNANNDGRLEISDPIATLEVLFLKPVTLPPLVGSAGDDPTSDALGCRGG